jgi:hypothetical protein
MTTSPALGWIRIRSVDPPISITARLSDAKPNVDQGYGGWQEVARPRRTTLSVWQGLPAMRMSIPILLDKFRTQGSIERECAQLERLASPSASDGTTPRVSFAAKGGAIPHQGRIWVVDNLTWGDAAMTTRGNRCRQQVTLSLLEYIADVRVDQDSPSQRQRAKVAAVKTKSGASQKRVVAAHGRLSTHPTTSPSTQAARSFAVARATLSASTAVAFGSGDDLLSIAARELGDADRWVEIAQLNGIRDPRSIAPGQVIRLP